MKRIVIAHIVHRFAIGGLENGVVNLVNHLPAEKFRHIIVSLTEITGLTQRVKNPDVSFHALGKREGLNPMVYLRLWWLLRRLRPDIVHTRNLGTLDCQLSALLAGVRIRIHGEHGRDIRDLERSNRKHLLLRRAFRPLISSYVALSMDIATWLRDDVGVPAERVVQIYNGVDTDRFTPASPEREAGVERNIVIGTVGRLQGEKDPLTLVRAFAILLSRLPHSQKSRVCLVMAGDGPMRAVIEQEIHNEGMSDRVVMTGSCDDVAAQMRSFDIFVLPSLTEGISNTILEAMACGLPVVATRVGGNSELVVEGETGLLVDAGDPDAIAEAMAVYVGDSVLRVRHGEAGRRRALEKFSLGAMVAAYEGLYDRTMRA